MAGLGNIYVDEVLWAAKVHPEMPAKELSKAAMKRVHDQTIAILQLGIEKGGSTIRTYRNAVSYTHLLLRGGVSKMVLWISHET